MILAITRANTSRFKKTFACLLVLGSMCCCSCHHDLNLTSLAKDLEQAEPSTRVVIRSGVLYIPEGMQIPSFVVTTSLGPAEGVKWIQVDDIPKGHLTRRIFTNGSSYVVVYSHPNGVSYIGLSL